MAESLSACCGIIELHLNHTSPEQLCQEVRDDEADDGRIKSFRRLVVFSENVSDKNGARLAAYIHKNKLGRVIKSRPKLNPIHDSKVRAYIWEVDVKALAKKFKKTTYRNNWDYNYGNVW